MNNREIKMWEQVSQALKMNLDLGECCRGLDYDTQDCIDAVRDKLNCIEADNS